MKESCQHCFDVLEAYTRIEHPERFRTWYDECGFKDQNTLCLPFIQLMIIQKETPTEDDVSQLNSDKR